MSDKRLIRSMQVPQMMIQKYERYLPTAFDDTLTMLEKVNMIVEFLNLTLKHVDEVTDELNNITTEQNTRIKELRNDFDVLNEWVRGEGLELSTVKVLNEWFDDGRLANIINEEVFNMKANQSDLDQTNERLEEIAINVKDFGAFGDGTEVTTELQNAINSGVGGKVIVPSGLYKIDPTVGIKIPSNIEIIFHPNAVIQNIAHNTHTYQMFSIRDVENVVIRSGVFDGNRFENSVEGGEHGHAISIRGSKNIKLFNVKCINCWGDGIYIARTENLNYSENILIQDVICDNNRRQGISVISAKKLNIVRPILTNTNGTSPEAGIDFEPNYTSDVLKEIIIEDLYAKDNVGGGIIFYLNKLSGSNEDVDIIINNPQCINNRLELTYVGDTLNGVISINKPTIKNNHSQCITFRNYECTGPFVNISKPKIINCGVGGLESYWSSGVLVFSTEGNNGINSLGNFLISEMYIEGPNLPYHSVYYNDVRSVENTLTNVSFLSPISLKSRGHKFALIGTVGDLTIQDPLNQLKDDISRSVSLRKNYYIKTITNNDSTDDINLTLYRHWIGALLKFEVHNTNLLRITPNANHNMIISPITNLSGEHIQSRQKGASITLKQIDDNTWSVVNMVGNWTTVQ